MDRLLLVHGAFHGAWCWDRLRPELDRQGVVNETVELPFRTTDDDVAVVREAVDSLGTGGDGVTLLGHSFGGAVISAAAAAEGSTAYGSADALIYLTAIMTGPGQTVDFSGGPGMGAIDLSGPTAVFDRSRAATSFYNRCSPDDAAWATEQLRDMPTELLIAPLPAVPAWRVLPSTYVLCTDDRILSLPAQHQMAANAGATVTIDSDHSPFLSCPGLLAETIAGILAG
jgi:pimeloyl-ACP methyl ester carboxylesterase